MVVEQTLLQVKGKYYTWRHFLPEFSLHFCLKKNFFFQLPFPSAIHLARLLIPLDRRVLILARTKPPRPPL